MALVCYFLEVTTWFSTDVRTTIVALHYNVSRLHSNLFKRSKMP